MTLTIELPEKLDAALEAKARASGASASLVIQQILEQALTAEADAAASQGPELPLLRLGSMTSLHRRDIYDDVD